MRISSINVGNPFPQKPRIKIEQHWKVTILVVEETCTNEKKNSGDKGRHIWKKKKNQFEISTNQNPLPNFVVLDPITQILKKKMI